MFKRQASSIIGIVLIFFLLFIIILFGTPLLLKLTGLTKTNELVFFLSRILIWGCLLVLYLYVHYFEKQKLLIWKEKQYGLLFYTLSTIIIFVIVSIGGFGIGKILNASTHNETSSKILEYAALFKSDIPLLLFTTLTAAIVEELIFRGYIQTRLETIFKSPALAIVISSLIFAILHSSYGTLFQFLSPLFVGLVFSWFYWKYKNLKILILCHFLIDTISLLVLIKS
jgi:membrane protease YdiL (CAAX protease family)